MEKECYKGIIWNITDKCKNTQMKNYEIWTGSYSLGQGSHQGEVPEKVGKEVAISFAVACIKHELKERLKFIKIMEERNQENHILSSGLQFDFNLDTLSQPWLGGYYETESDALKTFNR